MKKMMKAITDKFKKMAIVDLSSIENMKRQQEAAKEAIKKARSEKA